MLKLCNKCKKELPITDFHKSGIRNGKQRYKPICKSCRNKTNNKEYIVPKVKKCSSCNLEKPIEEYPLNGFSTKGLQLYKGKCKSCSYKTNRRVGSKKVCINCGNDLNAGKKYCSHTCQHEYQFNEKINKWKNGELSGHHNTDTYSIAKWLRKYLLKKYNYKCGNCGFEGYNPDGNTILEVDHIDGNASNNKEENLRVLCPNCHAMTDNFRARNKSSIRNR